LLIEKLKAALESVLWDDPARAPAWRRVLLRPARILYAVIRDLADGQLNLRAMSLVYTTLLSLVPLLAITFSVLKGFGVHNQIEPLLLRVFAPLGDQAQEVVSRIVGFVNNMQVGVLGSVGLGLLLFTVVSLMQKIERSLNDIWQVPQDRPIAERYSGYLSILLVGPVLVFSSLGVTASIGHSSVVQAIASVEPFGEALQAAGRVVPYLMVILAFMLIYKLMPNTRVHWLAALIGGIVAGVLWETVGWAFAAYVVRSSNYPAIYSAFATLLLFMIWLYVSWLILLIGAAVAFYFQHPEYVGARRAQMLLSVSAQERLALAVAALIAKHFCISEAPWTLNDLARRFQVPEKVIANLLDILQRCHYVTASRDEPPGYLPARPPETINAAELLAAVRSDGRGDNRMTIGLAGLPAIVRTAEKAEAAMLAVLGGVTLKDLALDEGVAEDPALGLQGSYAERRSAAAAGMGVAAAVSTEPTWPSERPSGGMERDGERGAERRADLSPEGSDGKPQDRLADRRTDSEDERHEPIFGTAARSAGV
jgi:membrane protein